MAMEECNALESLIGLITVIEGLIWVPVDGYGDRIYTSKGMNVV